MSRFRHTPPALVAGLVAVALPVLTLLAVGVSAAAGRTTYEVVRDLFVPLVGPMVAVFIPVVLFFVIPYRQDRQKLALGLCGQYFGEEMREARNVGWRHFVTEQRQLPADRRAARLAHFLDYLTEPETHRAVDPATDAVYQKACRVLDFFAVADGCVARGVADPDMIRDFLLFYYLWWRDEIMAPLRATGRAFPTGPKFEPGWWKPLTHLDALSGASRVAT